MSRFFEALERAERDRVGGPRDGAPAGETVTAPRPVTEAPVVTPSAPPPMPPAPAPAIAAPPVSAFHLRKPVVTRPAAAVVDAPGDEPDIDPRLISLLAPATFEAEQYRALRHLVEQLNRKAGLKVLAVSSPGVGDGKTTTAINLAGSLAQAPEARVLLIDGDLRQSRVLTCLGADEPNARGLVDAIVDVDLRLQDLVLRFEPYNLDVLPAGARLAVPYELLKSERFGQLLDEARSRYDMVILDTSPIAGLPDCKVIEKWIDGFLIVVGAHHTPKRLVGEALEAVDPAKVVGLIYNGDDARRHAGYYSASRRPKRNARRAWHWLPRAVGGRPRAV